MSNHAIARIQWVSTATGGRKHVPAGHTYSTLARFDLQGDRWAEDAWSLVVDFLEQPDDTLTHLAKVRFLADGAPSGLLIEGSKCELLEGYKVVARGVICSQ
jgi:hypothetical protein